MQQHINQRGAGAEARRYRLFVDPGHSWLEVPRREVVASGATISSSSYYDPATDMAYLEEDADLSAFLRAVGRPWSRVPVLTVDSSMPRQLSPYDPAACADDCHSGGRAIR